MLIGFFLRRIVTVALCAAAFWGGVKADDLLEPGGTSAGLDCPEVSDGD